MATTDRQELFKKLWAMANDVRGALDGWDFKQYAYAGRQEIQYFAARTGADKIRELEYNLSVGMYVEKEDTREAVDIDKLEADIAATVQREAALRQDIDGIVAMLQQGRNCSGVTA